MTGIQRPYEDADADDADADADELQFHIELNEIPPPVSTVATFDTHVPNIDTDLESSWPAEDHAISKDWDRSHESEPCFICSLHFSRDNLDKTKPSPKTMAAQAMEALNRTFIELKSKNEETRTRASYDLRDLVASAARGKAFCSPSSFCTV